MTAVVGMLMKSWGIPRMRMQFVRSSLFEGNTGSQRVFEKNGFVLYKTVQDAMHVVARGERPEGLRTVHFMQWIALA
jgi:RimJ/RimL family protein N-acetyltransferase